jgi:multidrug efflux pump subunit AcrA (membrane-fusion protein)
MYAATSEAAPTTDLVGLLALEQFDATEDGVSEERATRVADLGALATRNALEYDTLPLRSVVQTVRNTTHFLRHQSSQWITVTVCCALIVLALIFIPAPFNVRAEGELQPAERRDIYAPLDGEVVEVRGQHDEVVEQDQVLLMLRSRPLEIEYQRLQGEYQTTEKRLFAVTSARVQSSEDRELSDSYPGQLAAEEQELRQLLESQRKQIELLRQQRELLSVRSPISGRVLTWNPRELLENRPVLRGQRLMTTANTRGPWVCELWVPESRVGYILAAQRDQAEPLDVTFALATDRGKTYTGIVNRVAARAEKIGEQPASVKITVTVPESVTDGMRPGAVVYAKIHCGTESLGFVWLHDIIEVLKARLFF